MAVSSLRFVGGIPDGRLKEGGSCRTSCMSKSRRPSAGGKNESLLSTIARTLGVRESTASLTSREVQQAWDCDVDGYVLCTDGG